MKKRKKKSNRTKLKERLWTLVKEYVYLRDKSTCQHCLRAVEGHNRHPSHVFGKGAYPRLEFDVHNVKTLCFHCHMQWWHLVPTEAYQWFSKEFPDRLEYLESEKLNQTKLTELVLEQKIKETEVLIEKAKSIRD